MSDTRRSMKIPPPPPPGRRSRQRFGMPKRSLPQPWEDIFGPLRHGAIDDLVLVGQCGQSIDARIATPSGHSHYINGEGGLAHLHRLRALVDAVVIGVGTAIADDPQLTVRRVEGPSPARVIIDPNGRLPSTARVLAADGIRRLVVTAAGTPTRLPDDVEIVPLAAGRGPACPGGHHCGARRARLPAHSDRRRRRHGLALPGRPLPRPAACHGRPDHPRRRAHRASRCRRSSGSRQRCARPCGRMCSTATFCSTAISVLIGCRSAGRKCRRDRCASSTGPAARSARRRASHAAISSAGHCRGERRRNPPSRQTAHPGSSDHPGRTPNRSGLARRHSRNARNAPRLARPPSARAPDRTPCRCADAG